ncbi:MAG TPA: response regulator [Clostridiaceae bacterium]|nr:response regulator [Clostridiaceae bacterium]
MLKVILIDDEELILRGLLKIIDWEANGFTVAGAFSDSEEALAMAPTLQPHLVIVDIEMPGLSGLELIDALRDRLPYAKFVILSAHDQFKYAQKALQLGVFRYLLKPIDDNELSEALRLVRTSIYSMMEEHRNRTKLQLDIQHHLSSLKSQIIREAVCDGFIRQGKDKPEFYDELLYNYSFHLCYIQICTQLNEHFTYTPCSKSHIDTIASYCTDELKCANIFRQEDCLVLVMDSPIHNIDFNLLTKKFAGITGMPVIIGLTQAFTGLSGAHSDYLKSFNSFQEEVFFTTESTFFRIASRSEHASEDFSSLLNDSKKILPPVLLQLDIESYSNYCENIYKYILAMKNHTTPAAVHTFYGTLLNFVKRTSMSISGKNEDAFIPVPIPKFRHLADYNKYIVDMTESFLAEAINLCNVDSTRIVNQVKLYIRENYTESDLKLNKIADANFINYSYLSYLFKKTTGKNFSSYLTEVRIDEAKKLLLHSSLPINEIAKRVGYQNYQNFHYAFKNICGKSPNTYRMQYSGQNIAEI